MTKLAGELGPSASIIGVSCNGCGEWQLTASAALHMPQHHLVIDHGEHLLIQPAARRLDVSGILKREKRP